MNQFTFEFSPVKEKFEDT